MAFTNTAAALRVFGGLFEQRLAQGMQENNSDASGELTESMAFVVRSKNSKVEMDFSMLDYYEFVDEGRKPGKQPPINSILKWLSLPLVRDKLSGGLSDAEVSNPEGLAFQIARKIGREGTKGTDFYTNVIESRLVTQDLPKLIQESVGEDIDELMGSLLDGIN